MLFSPTDMRTLSIEKWVHHKTELVISLPLLCFYNLKNWKTESFSKCRRPAGSHYSKNSSWYCKKNERLTPAGADKGLQVKKLVSRPILYFVITMIIQNRLFLEIRVEGAQTWQIYRIESEAISNFKIQSANSLEYK